MPIRVLVFCLLSFRILFALRFPGFELWSISNPGPRGGTSTPNFRLDPLHPPDVQIGCYIEEPVTEEEGAAAARYFARVPIRMVNNTQTNLFIIQVGIRASKQWKVGLEPGTDRQQCFAVHAKVGSKFVEHLKTFDQLYLKSGGGQDYSVAYFDRNALGKSDRTLLVSFREPGTSPDLQVTSTCERR